MTLHSALTNKHRLPNQASIEQLSESWKAWLFSDDYQLLRATLKTIAPLDTTDFASLQVFKDE
jgi:hypothetical protein